MEELPYRRLEAWQLAMGLAMAVLAINREPAVSADRVVSNQLARAATSVPANLAEGHGRGTARDFAAFVDRARGSLFELDTWLEFLRRDGRLPEARHIELNQAILRLNAVLFSLRRSLRERAARANERDG